MNKSHSLEIILKNLKPTQFRLFLISIYFEIISIISFACQSPMGLKNLDKINFLVGVT